MEEINVPVTPYQYARFVDGKANTADCYVARNKRHLFEQVPTYCKIGNKFYPIGSQEAMLVPSRHFLPLDQVTSNRTTKKADEAFYRSYGLPLVTIKQNDHEQG